MESEDERSVFQRSLSGAHHRPTAYPKRDFFVMDRSCYPGTTSPTAVYTGYFNSPRENATYSMPNHYNCALQSNVMSPFQSDYEGSPINSNENDQFLWNYDHRSVCSSDSHGYTPTLPPCQTSPGEAALPITPSATPTAGHSPPINSLLMKTPTTHVVDSSAVSASSQFVASLKG